jgi:MerR family transcriptional regulator/heat shock protein HspR
MNNEVKEQGMRRKKGFYSISVVAKMFSVHQQTIRMYEKQGLISPKRSDGNTRLFSEEDVDRLEEVIYLTHKLGVNLAGVEIILKLQKKVKRMQEDMNKMFQDTDSEFERETQQIKSDIKKQAERLVGIRRENIAQKNVNLIGIAIPGVDEEPKKAQNKKGEQKASGKEKTIKLLPNPSYDEPDDNDIEDIEIEYDKD